MKCDKCVKKATVHLTEIVDGKAIEMHLCEDCAREQSQHMEQQFGLADLLAGLTDFGKHVPDLQQQQPGVIQCAACGLTYEDFRKFGRFGCAQCYLAFKPQLKALLKKIHGSNMHLGKKPVQCAPLEGVAPVTGAVITAAPAGGAPKEDTAEDLRRQLQEAIAREDFERAAALRDRIHTMEGQE
jgi:protein arginine kinase activator